MRALQPLGAGCGAVSVHETIGRLPYGPCYGSGIRVSIPDSVPDSHDAIGRLPCGPCYGLYHRKRDREKGGGGETEREGEGEGKEEAGRGEVGGGEEREGEGVGERPGAGPQGAAEWGSIRDDCPHCSRAAPLRLWGSMTTQCTHLVNCPRCQLPRRALGALRRVRLADASLLRRPSRSAVAFSESREEPKPRDG